MNTVENKKVTDALIQQILNAELSDDQAFASGVARQSVVGGEVVTGPALIISAAQRNVLLDLLATLSVGKELDEEAVLRAMMDSVFQTLSAIVANLKPSEKELELRARNKELREKLERKKELLEELRCKLEDKAITLEEAVARFSDVILDPADRKLLDDSLASQRPAMA